jgi:hypothetical protein
VVADDTHRVRIRRQRYRVAADTHRVRIRRQIQGGGSYSTGRHTPQAGIAKGAIYKV